MTLKKDTHGERACYAAGCRCELCREANRAHQRLYGKGHGRPGTKQLAKKKPKSWAIKLKMGTMQPRKEVFRLECNRCHTAMPRGQWALFCYDCLWRAA